MRHHICHTLEQAASHLAGAPSSTLGGKNLLLTLDDEQACSEEQRMLTQQLNLISELADQLLQLANESRLLTSKQGATMPAQS
ncbi:MAG: hypothetical protein ACRDCX_06945 [Aeromonas sp.]